MKRDFLERVVSSVGMLLAVGCVGFAAPIHRGDVPADPAWILHFDCDGLRPTTIGQFLLREIDKPDQQAKFASFQSLFNFDLRTQLHGLTLYSLRGPSDDGVLLVYADFDADRLTSLAKSATDYQSSTHNQNVIHTWIDEGKRAKKGAKPRTYAAIKGSRIVFGQKEESVAEALDVMDGTAANLEKTQTYQQFDTGNNSGFIQAAARKLDVGDTGPQAAVSKLAKLLRLQIGETQKRIRATLSIEASESDLAGQIVTIGQGLLALMKLQTEKPEAVKLADALSLKQDGATVVVRLALPADEAIDLLQADSARKARKRAEAKKAHAK
jgi:hypothetical protein